MEKDLNNKEFYNDMLKEMVKYITVSKTEMSVMQTADAILHEYIKRTEHHIWLVNQCAGILKDVLVENGQDVSEFMARVEYHDYDKLHNPKIIPVYAVACDYYYGEGKKNYEVHEEDLYNEFELIAWPEHHRANVHHVAEHYGKSQGKDKPFIVPPTQDYLAIGEMIADWMAMSITHGDSAREWYKKTKGVKWTFEPIDEKIIEKFLNAEDEAHNQLAYLRQFKTWEVSTVAMQQAPTISEEDPQENNGVNEGIENFYRELEKSEDVDTKDTLYIEPIEQENLVDDESSELDTYIEQISKLVAEMEPMELNHKLGKYDDDELAIGKISDKNINMDIVNELMKYPRYLEVLKHWITVPDYTLLPDLARFGAIIDNIYKFNKPIVAYRGMRVGLVKAYKAQHEMGLVVTEDGGMNDDGIEMVLKVPKPGVDEGYSFDYTIDGPLSVSRSIWITKIYGNLIVKTVIPPTAKKLVITNELAYVLQKLEARYFNYRPMNLSSRTEIILFPNQTFKFEVVTTHGDISEELSEFNEMFYNMSDSTNEVVAGSENSIGHEAFCNQLLETKSCEGFFDAVSEKDSMHYTIRNFPAAAFLAKMKREYKTTKLEHLFSSIGIKWFSHRSVSIHKFFVPELLYLLQKFNFPKSLISSIEQNTWVSKPTEVTVAQNIGLIDKNMKCELFKHQQEFINSYSANKHENHLRGYLLSFDQGLGKTITALALMESLGKERVVIICPKNTMVETWGYHIETFYKNKQTIWYAGGKEKLTNQRFLIVNYDRISEIEAVAMSCKNLGIVVDESHNFLRTASQRTKILMEIASSTNDADILLQSGTPIKCTGVEMIPMMSVLDPYFDQEAVTTFKQTFGFNTSIANDVLHARLNRMMTRVTKSILDLPKKEESVIKVKMTTGKKYTLGVVKEGVRKFIAERRAYYHSKAKEYNDAFDEVLEWLDMSPMFKKDFDYMKWRGIIDWLRSEDISDVRGNTEIVWANKYEIEVIEPALPPELCKQFRWCKTAVKYVNLKIKGEVIGTYLMRLRMDMTSEMLEAADIKQYVDNAVKKTIIFTSYVDTIESAEKYFKNNGYNPLVVYGKTSSELTETVRRFQTDPGTNPLIASLKMLSTGATLTAANTVIFLNKPWRSIEYQQASDRVHRIGQDTDCVIYSLVLDTGAEDNLSTRMEDVMNWSDDQFSQIVDSKERSFLERVFGPMPIINWVRSFFSNEEYTNETFASDFSEKETSEEAIVPFISTSVYKQITDLAKPCYKPIGQNSWEHIQQVYSQASRICKKLFNRTLTPVEYAACLFHDCSVIDSGKDNHNQLSADKAVGILKDLFTPEELNIIHTAIVEHDNQVTSGQWKFSSSASEFVAAGDFNPPDAEWIMNKSYTWGITHGLDHAERITNMTALVKRAYSSTGEMWLHMPNAYKNYFATKINAVKKLFDKITPEEAEKIVMAYRKKHHLSDTDINLPTSSVETLSTKEYTEADINSVEDLKQFYKHCSYGLIDFKANKPWKETHNSTTLDDWDKHWKLLSISQLLHFKYGVCYDYAKFSDYFLTKLNVDHINLFAVTKRDFESGSHLNEDPNHTFTVYKDSNGKWKWLEAAWGANKNNTLEESSSDALIKRIGKLLANASCQPNLIGIIKNFPKDGVSLKEFYHAMIKTCGSFKYEIKPDVSYSKESISPDVKKKKQLIIDYICSICDIIDPSKLNSKRYHRLLDNMNDKEFDQWMHYVKEGKWRLHIVAPNLVINLKNENLLKAADKAKCKLFHRIWMTDHATGRQYLTDNEYLVLTLPVRRQQQFLDEKMSVPDNDRQIDGMTGQVTGDSRSSSITNPEIQILASRKLDATLEELVNVRGGNMLAYGEFKRQAEETGEINMSMFDPNTRSRVAVVGQVLLNSMHIDTNIVE